jgi:hypothetical protein
LVTAATFRTALEHSTCCALAPVNVPLNRRSPAAARIVLVVGVLMMLSQEKLLICWTLNPSRRTCA